MGEEEGEPVCLGEQGEMERTQKKDKGERGQSDETCVWKMGCKNSVQGSATQPFLPK